MKTDTLMQDLTKRIESYADLPWVNGYTSHGSFRPEGSPEGNIELKEIGNWLSIVAVFRWDGTTMDQTTDRSSGDPYSCVVRYSWIGPKESTPNKVSTPEELDTWASVSLKYASENTDVGLWGVHQGSWVEDLKEDGTVTIRDAKGSYQDEAPQSLGESRTIQLED
ncbi:MAG: hypothetical protein KAR03_04280 [Candidatus Thorarchaeota archaeon]|nr:hypothetical protein [Candidatus Thorarchaeota archaeon]